MLHGSVIWQRGVDAPGRYEGSLFCERLIELAAKGSTTYLDDGYGSLLIAAALRLHGKHQGRSRWHRQLVGSGQPDWPEGGRAGLLFAAIVLGLIAPFGCEPSAVSVALAAMT